MAIEIKIVNTQQQTKTMSLANGSNFEVGHGDSIRLLSKENFQTIRKGNDLMIKNVKGEEFVLKDFYTRAQNADEKQLLSWDDELNQEKELFSADSSSQIKLAEVDTGTVHDVASGGQELGNASAVSSGSTVAAGAGGISGMAMAGIAALAVGGVAVASSRGDGGNSSDKSTTSPAMTKVNEAPIITSGDSATVAENTTGVVYQAVATDPDGDNITYSLSGADADWFNIDAQTGAVSFKNAPDYEAIHPASVDSPPDGMVYVIASSWDNTYDINVIASDGTLSTEKAVTITVTDVNEVNEVLLGEPIYGTEYNDTFVGTSGIDYINGFAGDDVFIESLSRDVLTGGAGQDTFNFKLGWVQGEDGAIYVGFDPNSIDTITDFVSGVDTIGFEGSFILQSLSSYRITPDLLVQGPGAVALDANDYFIFDSNNGALYYDADGNGAATAQQFATLNGLAMLAASDIMISASDVIL